jgi:thiaminase/transcriptional activator TenA
MEAERIVSFIEQLEQEVAPQITAQLGHPFVRGIADGSLDPKVFENWVKQDYRYLIEYARVFGFCAARADTLEAMTWYANALHLTLATEMDLHRQYAERFGISADELESTPMWPTTRAYTDFLVRFAQSGDYAEAVAALLPCTWGYVDLALKLARGKPPEDQRYADWITQYSDAEFVAAAEWLKNEMERVAVGKNTVGRERLVDLFVTSYRYELAFWDMCWRGEG